MSRTHRKQSVTSQSIRNDNLPAQIRRLGTESDINEIARQRRWRESIKNLISINVTIDKGLIRQPIGVNTPNIDLDRGRPIRHKVISPLAVFCDFHNIVDTAVDTKQVELAHHECVRPSTIRGIV